MIAEQQVTISAPKQAVWKVITALENGAETISGIEQIEILEQPENGLVGLKWRETRTLFGKTATEIMWITDAVDNDFYTTRAESHGCRASNIIFFGVYRVYAWLRRGRFVCCPSFLAVAFWGLELIFGNA